jgi:gluconolactonase
MMFRRCCLGLSAVSLLAASAAWGQTPTTYPPFGKIVRLSPELDKIVPPHARMELLAEGFEWSEGPVWIKEGGYLLFSDIPRNSIMKWSPETGISLFMKPAGYTGVVPYGHEPGTNGLLVDPHGQLVACEHGDRRVSVLTKDGGKRTLVDNYQGKRFNSPNDGTFDSEGNLYFTDPPYGLPGNFDDPRRELDFCGVYRLSQNGELTLITSEMTRPNGIALSPDEQKLYVAQSDPKAPIWRVFDLTTDSIPPAHKVFFDATELAKTHKKGLPDGLKTDVHGNLFATGPGGVLVINPTGELIGHFLTGEATANCGWGDDGSTLYITADMFLVRIKLNTKGKGW